MTLLFDGKDFSTKKEIALRLEVEKRKIFPHLVTILVGDDPASVIYTNLKKKAVQRIGGDATVVSLAKNVSPEKIIEIINFYNNDPEIQGIMVQMPLPQSLVNCKLEIVNSIAMDKDVDGLRENSKFIHPTAKAIIEVLDFANGGIDMSRKLKCIVVGQDGMVGSAVTKELKKLGYELIKKIENADVVISATGTAGLITENMIKNEAIVIDVGYPKGDCDLPPKTKASFVTPVPGGVGPVTISCLLENLVSAC